jgi:hypothetical protein
MESVYSAHSPKALTFERLRFRMPLKVISIPLPEEAARLG